MILAPAKGGTAGFVSPDHPPAGAGIHPDPADAGTPKAHRTKRQMRAQEAPPPQRTGNTGGLGQGAAVKRAQVAPPPPQAGKKAERQTRLQGAEGSSGPDFPQGLQKGE